MRTIAVFVSLLQLFQLLAKDLLAAGSDGLLFPNALGLTAREIASAGPSDGHRNVVESFDALLRGHGDAARALTVARSPVLAVADDWADDESYAYVSEDEDKEGAAEALSWIGSRGARHLEPEAVGPTSLSWACRFDSVCFLLWSCSCARTCYAQLVHVSESCDDWPVPLQHVWPR
jgi:hypothetical protein